jgi:hypothetical protein
VKVVEKDAVTSEKAQNVEEWSLTDGERHSEGTEVAMGLEDPEDGEVAKIDGKVRYHGAG